MENLVRANEAIRFSERMEQLIRHLAQRPYMTPSVACHLEEEADLIAGDTLQMKIERTDLMVKAVGRDQANLAWAARFYAGLLP